MALTIAIGYSSAFIRMYGKLEPALQSEVREKIALFEDRANHAILKVHKLHGKLKDQWAFSVNYKYRVVFEYRGKNKVALLAVDDHDIYN